MLSILITSDLFKNDDETIKHEIFLFYLAGMKTIQISTTNLIYYLNKDSVSAAEAEEIESALPPDTPYLASTSFIKKYGLLHSLCCKLISIEQKHFRLASPIRNQFHRPSNMGLCQKSVSSSLVC